MKKVTFLLLALLSIQLSYGQGEWTWSNQLKTDGDLYPSSTIVTDIQVDDQNNIYHCGQFDGTDLTIQGISYPNSGNWDAFVCKFDPQGNLLWLNRIHSPDRDEAASIVIVGSTVYVAGSYKDRLVFTVNDTLNHDDNYDAYLASYDLDGNFNSAEQIFSGISVQRIKDMTYDPYSSNLVFTGFFKTEITYFDGTSLITNPVARGGKDLFFAKASTAGVVTNFYSAFTFQSNNGSVIKDINVSPDTSYYFTGDLFDTLIFPGTPNDSLIGTLVSDALIFKMDKNLNPDWIRTGGGTGSDHANSATSDEFGNVYVAGKIESNIVFDSTDVLNSSVKTGALGSDLYILKYNTNGRLLWFKRKGHDGNDDAFGLDISENLIQFCGNFADTLIINTDTLTSSGTTDINTGFAIFDLEGNEVGGKSIGGVGEDVGRAVRFDNNGHTIISGYFTSSTIQIGDSNYTNTSTLSDGRDGFIGSYQYPFRTSLLQTGEILCAGDSTGLIATTYFGKGPYTYEWSGNTTYIADSLAFGLPAGTYTVTVTDSRDSVAFSTIVIEEPPAITIDLDSTNLTCYQSGDGAVAMTVGGGTGILSYVWSGAPGIIISAKDQSGLSAGKCFVTVTDENGCFVDDSTEVIQPAIISSTAAVGEENPGLSDGSINLTVLGGTTPYSYSWTFEGSPFPGSTNVLTSLEEGLYTAYIEDINLCTYDTNIIVPGVALRVVLEGTNVTCKNANNGIIRAGIASGEDASETYTYEFLDADKNQIYIGPDSSQSNLVPGWYYVNLTELPSAETSSDSVLIIEPDSISVSFDPDTANCFGELTSITTMVSGGKPGYNFSWSNGAETESISNVPAGKYILTITDANSCVLIDSSETIQPNDIVISITETQSITCYGNNNGELTASVSGGTSPYQYLWDDNSSQDTRIARILTVGTYEVQVTDDHGCIQNKSYQINEPPMLQLSSIDTGNISCLNSGDGFFGVSMKGGTPPFSYSWTSGAAGDTNFAINLFPISYSVTVSDSRGCGDSIYSFKVKNPAEALSVIEDVDAHEDNICFDGNIGAFKAIPAGGWGNYKYSITGDSDDWQESSVFTNLIAGNFTLSVKDNEGCIETIEITIDQPSELFFNLTQVDGNSIIVDGSGGTPPYKFSLDNLNWQIEKIFSDLIGGDYFAYLTDANNCSPATSESITVNSSSLENIESAIAKIYPNPSQGNLFVEFDTPSDGEFHVEVFSLTGIQVFEETKMIYSGEKHPVKIDISNHPKGIYLLKVNGIVLTTKIIVE